MGMIVDDSSDPRKNRLEQYRKKIAVMPLETPKQYRSRVGRISRHRYLMDNRPAPAQRKAEIEIYHETVERVTAKHQQVLADIKANTPTFREKQIAYDTARGAYESRTFLEATLRMKGIEPAADIEDMKTQYQEWKNRTAAGVLIISQD
jgi:hypothetical protein